MSPTIGFAQDVPKTLWACRRYARERWTKDRFGLTRRKKDQPCRDRRKKGLCYYCPGPVKFRREG